MNNPDMNEPEKTRSVVDQLETVRAAVRDGSLAPRDRQEFEYALDALERELQVAEPADPQPFVQMLRDWEARLEVEHPVLAGVITDTLRTLSSMGI